MATAHPEITFARSLPLAARNGVLALVMEWDARFRARQKLARLGPERRRDLGLTDADIDGEVAKFLWHP
jgi:uncharacterized protein YjiS (DUF1127 family)